MKDITPLLTHWSYIFLTLSHTFNHTSTTEVAWNWSFNFTYLCTFIMGKCSLGDCTTSKNRVSGWLRKSGHDCHVCEMGPSLLSFLIVLRLSKSLATLTLGSSKINQHCWRFHGSGVIAALQIIGLISFCTGMHHGYFFEVVNVLLCSPFMFENTENKQLIDG